MEDPGKQDIPPPAAATSVQGRRPLRGRGLALAWALFLAIGLPFGFMATLGYLATAGVYIESLRPFWQPWPPDMVKSFVGVAAFAATLAYLAYRLGRSGGYRSGSAAAKATARNIAEGR